MRHATAPGTGDPPGFTIDDCSTQRTLSAEGRVEAKRIGAAFRARAVLVGGVWSSQWCRCLETAELLDLGTPIPLPALNSFFEERGEEAERTASVHTFLASRPPASTVVLVTHQVNITALTGIVPRPGETVVAKPLAGGGLAVVGRIPPP
jgi:broad specificity phosphatase PhoE